MAESGLQELHMMVAEQQAQISYLTTLSDYLVQAHLTLREDNNSLTSQHNALCESLRHQGVVSEEHSQSSFKAMIPRDHDPQGIGKLLPEPEVADFVISQRGSNMDLLLKAAAELRESVLWGEALVESTTDALLPMATSRFGIGPSSAVQWCNAHGEPVFLPHLQEQVMGCSCLTLMQELWYYSMSAEIFSGFLDLGEAKEFRTASRASLECMREICASRGFVTKLDPWSADSPPQCMELGSGTVKVMLAKGSFNSDLDDVLSNLTCSTATATPRSGHSAKPQRSWRGRKPAPRGTAGAREAAAAGERPAWRQQLMGLTPLEWLATDFGVIQ